MSILAILLSSCGSDGVMDKQKDERQVLSGALNGVWVSTPANNQITQLTIQGNNLTVQRTTYDEPECVTALRTVSQPGTFTLTNDYKEGVDNSIVWIAGTNLTVTLHQAGDVNVQNQTLASVRLESPNVTPTDNSDLALAEAHRKAEVITETQKLSDWKLEEAKTLNRYQWEGVSGSSNFPVFQEFGTAQPYRYEVDNSYLQVDGLGVFKHQ